MLIYVMFKLVSLLPNIIILRDFHFASMSWPQPGDCFIYHICVLLSNHYFFQLYVNSTTTYKENNILDLVFGNSDLIDSIDICDTFISEHCLLTVNTSIPVCFYYCKPSIFYFGNAELQKM